MEGVQVDPQPPPSEADGQQAPAAPPAAPSPENGDHNANMGPQAQPRPPPRHPAAFANIFDSPVLLPMLTVSWFITEHFGYEF